MLKTAYIYPHNTPSIVNRGKIINYTKYFITDVFCVFQIGFINAIDWCINGWRIIPCCRNAILCCIIIYLINLDKKT